MEIKNISGIVNVYNKIKLNSGKTKVAPAEKKTDKIEFNFARSVEGGKGRPCRSGERKYIGGAYRGAFRQRCKRQL